MDILDKYFFQPQKFEDIIDTAKIVIDTNVLLAAYQYRDLTFNELINTLEKLNQQERLIIPSHVLKEFFKNRPKQIVEIIQTIQQFRDGLPTIKEIKNMETKIPSLDYLSCNEEIKNAESAMEEAYRKYNENLKVYREKLTLLINEVKSFFNSDPILERYKNIFYSSFFKPETLRSEEEITVEFKERVKNDIPPGLKDAQKSQNGEGDYLIWEHILQIKDSDVIFITADNKPDWVYKEPYGNGNLISARRELVEEFYDVSGKTICIIHPSEFLKAFKPTIDNEIIQDLNTTLLDQEKDKINEYIRLGIEAINNEGNSAVANAKYGMLVRKINQINNNGGRGYRKGTNLYLDGACFSIINDKQFYEEVLRRADNIALDTALSIEEKKVKYEELADWAILNQA